MWSPINRMTIAQAITNPQSSNSKPKNSARTDRERATGLRRSGTKSPCEGTKELQHRRQQECATCTGPLLSAWPFTSDVCNRPHYEESSTKDAEALCVAEGVGEK